MAEGDEDEGNMKVTVKECLKGMIIVGIATFIGRMLLGPPGLVVGGVVGGLAAYGMSCDFKSAPQILRKPPKDKK
ncbi:Hypothetical predicted protein [Octopus vulgaris]|uniref:Uncharacterized protein n=2 Tax=Octopus TaxID=6643 RepID=A0AA36F329_OCTVU|nr:protein C19orf12-like [Octopus sinensis]CAI9723861.1 Hypothetical predicted protein [Octopus vulgaris]